MGSFQLILKETSQIREQTEREYEEGIIADRAKETEKAEGNLEVEELVIIFIPIQG